MGHKSLRLRTDTWLRSMTPTFGPLKGCFNPRFGTGSVARIASTSSLNPSRMDEAVRNESDIEANSGSIRPATRIRQMVPPWAKKLLRPIRRQCYMVAERIVTALRAKVYQHPEARWIRLTPALLSSRLRLHPPHQSRRIEVGSGHRPQNGYLHVDVDPFAPSLDLLIRDWRLPLPDDWADELLSIHMIEHIAPSQLQRTLEEWRRVLVPGGRIEVHTPSGRVLGRALASGLKDDESLFWAIQSAIYGLWSAACRLYGTNLAAGERGDHRTLLTRDMLSRLLARAGFTHVEDFPEGRACWHQREWAPYIPDLYLEMGAIK